MRRKDKERDAAFAWQVMAEAPYATLSLVDGEGRPYAVPVSQAAWPEGECIYFHCAIGGKKYEIFENGCEAVMSAGPVHGGLRLCHSQGALGDYSGSGGTDARHGGAVPAV